MAASRNASKAKSCTADTPAMVVLLYVTVSDVTPRLLVPTAVPMSSTCPRPCSTSSYDVLPFQQGVVQKNLFQALVWLARSSRFVDLADVTEGPLFSPTGSEAALCMV